MTYKEQELGKTQREISDMQEKLKTSNTEKLHDEILKLNIANAKVFYSWVKSLIYHKNRVVTKY